MRRAVVGCGGEVRRGVGSRVRPTGPPQSVQGMSERLRSMLPFALDRLAH
ncbi:hypothetical protein Ae263Ps1_5588c [Pseudonocardia sp. Ae263_Ps1]|nr:hypothetical protein Ae150APs1_5733 [Pseudonocardia sp. Ae150A_Ps1]OLL88533.1 hypothetical protein Ae263Ps1_5588c [Pseudonocardia sp. Ae263_Ps1]OLL91444.1 hypothetical protein Ae356Ps1_1341 [Pseudonocardia sp. Ae356_Ps1]